MIGGSIVAVPGLSVELARGGTPLAFILAEIVALVTSYSYARLSLFIPSPGGTAEFINQAFGWNLLTGTAKYPPMVQLYFSRFALLTHDG